MNVVGDCDPSKSEVRPAPWLLSSRLGLALISSFVLMSMTSQRASMYVAIPCMVNQSALDAEMGIIVVSGTKIKPTPPPTFKKATSQKASRTIKKCNSSVQHVQVFSPEINLTPLADGEFVWTEDQQTLIYKVFYWGYLVAQVPAGWCASRFGSRNILAGFLMVGSLSTIMVPLSTTVHYFILLVVRFVGGVGAGAVFPSIIALWAKWAPPGERSRLLTISFSGSTLGLVLSYPVAGFLCRYGFDGGWRSIFYIFGGLGCIGSVIWFMFVSDSPLTHRRISKEEKIYIVTSLSGETDIEPNTEFDVPWWNLLRSLPFLSLAVCHFTCEWALYTFETKVPVFMKTIVKMDVQRDPVLWLLPYIGLWLVVLISGVWADKLRTRAVVRTSNVRKLMQSIGTLVPAAFVFALGFLDCEHVAAAIAIEILGIAFIGFQYSGFLVNHLDIYPKYAGVAIGLCNSIGAASELVAPMLLEAIMKTKEQNEWQMIFIITAAFLGFSALSFALCGTGDLQPWAACPEFDLDDLIADSVSDYDTNDGTSIASDDSSDIISGEQTNVSKKRKDKMTDKTHRKQIPSIGNNSDENETFHMDPDDKQAPELPDYTGIPLRGELSVGDDSVFLPIRSTVPRPSSQIQHDGTNSPFSKYDDDSNFLSQYDTLPARGRPRSLSPDTDEKQKIHSYMHPLHSPLSAGYFTDSLDGPSFRSRTRSPSNFSALDNSLSHSIASEEPYDSVGGGTLPGYSTRSRNASPAFGGSFSSLQQPPSPGAVSSLSRRSSRASMRGQANPQVPPRTSLTGLAASRQRSMTPTTFPQPESGHSRPSIDSSTTFEQLEESIV